MEPQVGSSIGDYQVMAILGAGGMGKVYKVRNTISDRVEAMKVLLPDLASAPELADRFLREIKVQASLEHPNIAALHTAVRIDNQLVMLMEFVDGITLEQKLKDLGRLPVGQAVDAVSQVLSALEYAHGRGVVHRDIKPANMMLTPQGVVKLMDFGIARGAHDHKLTMTGTTLGSLYYMSPEQIQGVEAVDARADLYSLGVSLYELVTGKRPFDGDSQFAIMSAHLNSMPAPPIDLDPKLPRLLSDVILMSVMKDRNARFQSAKAFRNALANLPAQELTPTVTAPAHHAPAAAPPPPVQMGIVAAADAARGKSHRGLWMGVGALACAAAIAGLIAVAPWKGPKAQTAAPAAVSSPAAAAPAAAAPAETAASPNVPPASPPPAAASQPAPETATAAKPEMKRLPPPESTVARTQPGVGMATPAKPKEMPPQSSPAQQAVAAPQQASVPPPAAQSVPPAPVPAQADHRRELQEIREKLALMENRAQSIRETLGNLRRSQQASGYGLGSQYTGPSGLMETYLRGASDALNAGDPDAAKRFLEKAEPPIAALERLLNK